MSPNGKKTKPHSKAKWNVVLFTQVENLCAAYLTGTKATRANVYSFGSAVYNSLNSTNVGLPSSVCSTVRVRYGLTENNALSANFAFCHA